MAVKILDISRIQQKKSERQALMHEITINQTLRNCEGVLGLLEIYEDHQNIYLVLEY